MSNLSVLLALVLFYSSPGLRMRSKDAIGDHTAASYETPIYFMIKSGTCEKAGYVDVKSSQECRKAGTVLRLSVTGVGISSRSTTPSGCYYRRQSSTKKLWYNKYNKHVPASSSRPLICSSDLHDVWFRNLQGLGHFGKYREAHFYPRMKRFNGRPVWILKGLRSGRQMSNSSKAYLFFARGHYRVGATLSNRSDAGVFRSVTKANRVNSWLRDPFDVPNYEGWEIKDKSSRTGWKVSRVIVHYFQELNAQDESPGDGGDIIECRHKATGKLCKDRRVRGKSAFLPDDPSRRRSGQPCSAFKTKHCGAAALTSRRRALGAEALNTCKATCRLNVQRLHKFYEDCGLGFGAFGYNYDKASAMCQSFDRNCIAQLTEGRCV